MSWIREQLNAIIKTLCADVPISRVGVVTVGSGVDSVDVAYTSDFPASVTVADIAIVAMVYKGDVGDPTIFSTATINKTASGFTVLLSGATPNADYCIHYTAGVKR